MEEHIRAGHGVKGRFGEHLWLDITLLGKAHIDGRLREVKEICQHFLGIDPARPDPGAPGPALFDGRHPHRRQRPVHPARRAVCGEAACWDLHGFNRLGGNSVAETVVAGMIVGETMADFVESSAGDLQVSTALVREFLERNRPGSTLSSTATAARTPRR